MFDLTTQEFNLLIILSGLFAVAGVLFVGAILTDRWQSHHHSPHSPHS